MAISKPVMTVAAIHDQSEPAAEPMSKRKRTNAEPDGSRIKIQILTNLYPLPWEPNRASFNRQQFDFLSRHCDIRLTVLIGWLSALGKKKYLLPISRKNLQINYKRYFYAPAFARSTHALTLYQSLLTEKSRIDGYDPDCILVSWAYPDGVAGVALARKLGIPVIVKVHGSDVNTHLLHTGRANQIIRALNRADAIVCVSQALAQTLAQHGIAEKKIHVLYNGIDHELFHPADSQEARERLGLPTERKILLFIGNLKPAKGCEDLLEAFSRIHNLCPDLDLYFIGSGPAGEAIASRANTLKLNERVTLVGNVNHDHIPLWINASDVVSLPSHNEGVPNVLLEAMACGKPVVATGVGGIPEIVPQEAGTLVESQDPVGLANALVATVAQEWDSAGITQCVNNFSWPRNAEFLLRIVKKVTRDSKLD